MPIVGWQTDENKTLTKNQTRPPPKPSQQDNKHKTTQNDNNNLYLLCMSSDLHYIRGTYL